MSMLANILRDKKVFCSKRFVVMEKLIEVFPFYLFRDFFEQLW